MLICQSIGMPVWSAIRLPVHLFIHPSDHVHVSLSVCPSISLFLSICKQPSEDWVLCFPPIHTHNFVCGPNWLFLVSNYFYTSFPIVDNEATTLSKKTLGITTLSVIWLIATSSKMLYWVALLNKYCLSLIVLSVIGGSAIVLSVIRLSDLISWVSLCWVSLCWVSLCWVSMWWVSLGLVTLYAEFHCDECHYVDSGYAECH